MSHNEKVAALRAQLESIASALAELETDDAPRAPMVGERSYEITTPTAEERGLTGKPDFQHTAADGRAEALRRFGAKSTSDADQTDTPGRTAGVAEAARRYGARS